MAKFCDNEVLRKDCWIQAIYTFGTAYIFEQRQHKFRKYLRGITFLGIAVPLSVGGVVGSFGINSRFLPYLLGVAGVLGVVQLILSLWAIVAKWDDELAYSLESMTDNNRLSAGFERLGKISPSDIKLRFEILQAENQARINSDNKQGINDKEKRMGMRASLRQFQKECSGCGLKPTSMVASDCDVCGNF